MDASANDDSSTTLAHEITTVDTIIDDNTQTDLVLQNKSEPHLGSCNEASQNVEIESNEIKDTQNNSQTVVESVITNDIEGPNDIETPSVENTEVASVSEFSNSVHMTSDIELGAVVDTSINAGPSLMEKSINEGVDNECILEPQQIQNAGGGDTIVSESITIECIQNTNPQEVIDDNSELNLQAAAESNLHDIPTKELQSSSPVEDNINLEETSDKIIDNTIQINEENAIVIQSQEIFNNHEEISQDNILQDAVPESTKGVEVEQVLETQLIESENVQEKSFDIEAETGVASEDVQEKPLNVETEIVTHHNIVIEHIEGNDNIEHLNTPRTAEIEKMVKNEVISENITDAGETIEQQMSNLVHETEYVETKDPKSLSIVEAISRDFDETDSEDVDRLEQDQTRSLQITQDNVIGDVSINDALPTDGTVTVTAASGEIYYVQSVDNLVVVENDEIDESLDEPETFEVTVLSEAEEPIESTSTKTKDKPSIPSHILGRNINNPVVDTFRNGKIPPKPRLGVKIPYKNLTSQIVSKDEIAKEILERQKTRYKQTGQTTREMLFANKLTQRLAKKIAPASPTPPKATVTVQEKLTKVTINNSDLLAILEDDTDDPEVKKGQEAGTSKTNIEEKHTPPTLSKRAEREIALKQLQEMPVTSTRRRTRGYPIHRSHLESETVAELQTEVSHSIEESQKKENEKLVQNNEQKAKSVIQELPQKSDEKKSTPLPQKPDEKKSTPLPQKPDEKKSTPLPQKPDEKKTTPLPQKPDEKKSTPSITSLHSTQKTTEKSDEKLETPNLPTENEAILADKDVANIIEEVKDTKAPSINTKTTELTQKPNVSEITSKSKQPNKEQVEIVKKKTNEVKQNISQMTTDVKVTEAGTKTTNKPDINVTEGKEEFVERKVLNQPVKTYARKRKSTEDLVTTANVPDKKPAIQQKDINIPPNTYITKSSRIIKRKVIWDPDEPTTVRSLAGKSPKSELIKERIQKQPDTITKKVIPKPVQKPEIIKIPVKSPELNKGKKRLSEVDKLLMDEGTVNMLYAFKKVEDIGTKKKKSSVISLDRAQKDLMSKANELIKDLKTNSDKVSPKSLRKKDSPSATPSKKVVPASISRKRSKDSNRSSLYSPPASPSMMHMNNAEASRIIRRHSSSSFSSLDGDFDADKKSTSVLETTGDAEKPSKRRNTPSSAETNKVKRPKKNPEKENVTATTDKSKTANEKSKSPSKLAQNDEKRIYEKYKTFSVKKSDHMVQIILLPSFNNEAYLTPEILNDLCNILKELEQDNDCTVLVISSTASAFCHGINYKTLISDKEQSRKTFARKLAVCVTNFLRALATFPKILVAGVHGDTVGLGVTILPLFDMVIASDTATFSIPNARLGCAVEGGSLFSLPHLMHNVLVSELLYASRKLIAAETLRLGMVTRVIWPEKFQQELVGIVKSISNYSPQFMELTKKQLRQHMLKGIEEALSKEIDTLIQHWTSSECQKNFGVYG